MPPFKGALMTENDIYQKHLNHMYELHGVGEGAILSYMKRNLLSFEKEAGKGSLPILFFAECGFDRVLKEMSTRGLDFRTIKEEGSVAPKTVLDDYLEQAKWYDADCLHVIINAGNYSKEDLAKSFIKLCNLHKEHIQTKEKKTGCLNLDIVTDVFLKEGFEFSLLANGKVPFYALCDIYDLMSTKKIEISESYQKMIVSCIQKGLDAGVDLNVVDENFRTGFSFKSMELKSKFVRYQSIKDDERLLDLFMVVEGLLKGDVAPDAPQKIAKHVHQLRKDISNAKKRMRF